MSECMTITDVFAAEEKYPDEELATAKDIARSILSEALHSVVANSEKVSDSNHVGDCKIEEEFFPEFGCLPVNCSQSAKEEISESCKEKKWQEEEKSKEYRVIKEQALADSELRIQNGKIHLQSNGAKAIINLSNFADISAAKEVNKSQSCVKGGSDKKVDSSSENVLVVKSGQEKPEECSKEEESVDKRGEDCADYERPFTPFTTEDLRKSILQVWKNVNSPALNGLDGELVCQSEEVVRLMEELATIQVVPNAAADPNRPRAYTVVEEDVKKMIKEIEDMNFKSNVASGEEVNTANVKGITTEEKMESGVEEVSATEEEVEGDSQDAEMGSRASAGSAVAFRSEKFNQSLDSEAKDDMFTAVLTESDEAFIESSESVIQIIEPQDDASDANDENEEGTKITFSLLNELDRGGGVMMDGSEGHGQYDADDDDVDRQVGEEASPRFRSGITTVGPIKNANCDPKLLTGPEVDYGKMTRIRGSRELTKGAAEEDLKSLSSRKILPDERDDNRVMFFENGYVEFDTIVNHDIASLTKMQKVKEVLSDQPRSDEELRGEEKLMRSPLDLKDVDADSCDSYNVIDIGIPLLSAEETSRNNADKDVVQVILNGRNFRNAEASNSVEKNPVSKDEKTKTDTENLKVDDHLLISSSVMQISTGQSQKHNTISRVLQKASNKFIMKDSDSFLRNSRSLPRDPSKIANTESFRSLLDDCQISAATVLKKSRSLLSNTQNALRAVSKTGFGHIVSGDKQMQPVDKSECRQSTSSRKREFIKFKDNIKSKVGKTLKSLESAKVSGEGADQSENQKKPSPKSPLVCPNKLLRKKSSENRKVECEGSRAPLEDRQRQGFDGHDGNQTFASNKSNDGNENTDKEIEVICGVKFQGSRRFAAPNGYATSQQDPKDAPSEKVDYVLMETVHENSAAATDEENRERPKSAAGGPAETGERVEAKKSLTLPGDAARDVPIASAALHKALSNGKLNRKNKKFSARIRSFWQTAFGKAKATTQRKDVS